MDLCLHCTTPFKDPDVIRPASCVVPAYWTRHIFTHHFQVSKNQVDRVPNRVICLCTTSLVHSILVEKPLWTHPSQMLWSHTVVWLLLLVLWRIVGTLSRCYYSVWLSLKLPDNDRWCSICLFYSMWTTDNYSRYDTRQRHRTGRCSDPFANIDLTWHHYAPPPTIQGWYGPSHFTSLSEKTKQWRVKSLA